MLSSHNFYPSIKTLGRSVIFLVIFGCGFLTAWLSLKYTHTGDASTESPVAIREINNTYTFIKPLLGCRISDNKEFSEYLPLKQQIENAIERNRVAHKVDSVAVYFRNLNTGRWTGMNENEKYAPASLYKIVLMMAYLKEAEHDSSLMDKKIIFPGTREKDQPDFPPMTPGQVYTIRELINKLIIYSDNDAKDLLHDNIGQNVVNDIFTDLGLDVPVLDETGDSMSAKSYSIFFRILYNGTYLSKDMSEYALSILSKSEFKDGIVAPLPLDITVSHKFGYRTFPTEQNGVTQELHDCGIVYDTSQPYFLCVMTKGWQPNDLKSTIQEISRMVFKQIGT